eukprot:CAMPEP_0179179528 /NCGR_PEP_ID=MMETSP0796-20121207/88853_1 /TAXON_ID=73915 /ORGANISM="Pyrodinium bahamense, Strain pbaha01" /LENGTH=126 /DNA_ID=CAMNT_0020883195 /DNA_START=196 /DNA_END=573 /DNA_ORIENTATION=+
MATDVVLNVPQSGTPGNSTCTNSRSFARCQTASTHLRQRWALLRREGRHEQLAWEARQVTSREPDWPAAQGALCVALIGLHRCEEAMDLAARGAARWPQDQTWQELQRAAREAQRDGGHRPDPPPA